MSASARYRPAEGTGRILWNFESKNQVSRFKVKEFIRMGMPADIIGCVWYAHAENIDEWFKRMTQKDCSKAPEDVFDSAE